jgi:uncharacterized membrane protein YphA (DoxX/SURF4 family)
MHPLLRAGRIIFAIALIGDAGLQINIGQFIFCRPPGWPFSFGGSTIWAYVSAAIFIVTAIAVLLNNKFATPLLLISGALIILYTVVPFLRGTISDAFHAQFRTNEFKCLAMSGGMFMLASTFSKQPGPGLVWIGRILLALFFIIAGVQHFQFNKFVEDLIPDFIPAHAFWTYFAAIGLIAGGIGILINRTAYLAALLSGIMVFGWFVLLHIPRAVYTPKGDPEWMGVFESLAFSGLFFALAAIMKKFRIMGK